eukprot:TRINITY_DN61537_c0_g1_i1.p1 TRINITY_DN61537_c0_g1~~TRINITY_DN61537_c0_g1_i1.p1  ORF type:complete len:214 (+),score=52.29 TRINITY_DN61537_c0_g1_i1:93-734(+)
MVLGRCLVSGQDPYAIHKDALTSAQVSVKIVDSPSEEGIFNVLDLVSEADEFKEDDECRSSVWEAETESEDELHLSHTPGSVSSCEDFQLLLQESVEQLEDEREWETFTLQSDRCVSEDVLPTILEDETLHMPQLRSRSSSIVSQRDIMLNEPWLQQGFEALSSLMNGVWEAGLWQAQQTLVEATSSFLGCSVAFDSFVEMHANNSQESDDDL